MSIKMIVTIAAAAIFLIVFFQIATHRLNEEKAFDTMKLISSAQRACKEAKGRYGTLKELADAGLIKSALSDGRDGGTVSKSGSQKILTRLWLYLRSMVLGGIRGLAGSRCM
jgi:hypothetical protein